MFSDVLKKRGIIARDPNRPTEHFSHRMRKLAILLKKEFLRIFRDKFILRSMLLLPVFQLLILPLAADYDIRNLRRATIDRDNTQSSRRLLTKFQAAGYFSLTEAAAHIILSIKMAMVKGSSVGDLIQHGVGMDVFAAPMGSL